MAVRLAFIVVAIASTSLKMPGQAGGSFSRWEHARERYKVRQHRASADWTYAGTTGPGHWPELYEGCRGERQSPIDIASEMQAEVLSPADGLEFEGWDVPSTTTTIKHDGKTVIVHLSGDYHLRGGGLRGRYRMAWLTFHWGHSNGTGGSEHRLSGRSFPLEVQIYGYSQEHHSSFAAAMKAGGNMAALSILFEIAKGNSSSSSAYTPLLEAVKRVCQPDLHDKVSAFRPADLLPESTDEFFRYSGTTTTPPCAQGVEWTVFPRTVHISAHQLEALYGVLIMERAGYAMLLEYLQDNFRPPQPPPSGADLVRYRVGPATPPTTEAPPAQVCANEPRNVTARAHNATTGMVMWERPAAVYAATIERYAVTCRKEGGDSPVEQFLTEGEQDTGAILGELQWGSVYWVEVQAVCAGTHAGPPSPPVRLEMKDIQESGVEGVMELLTYTERGHTTEKLSQNTVGEVMETSAEEDLETVTPEVHFFVKTTSVNHKLNPIPGAAAAIATSSPAPTSAVQTERAASSLQGPTDDSAAPVAFATTPSPPPAHGATNPGNTTAALFGSTVPGENSKVAVAQATPSPATIAAEPAPVTHDAPRQTSFGDMSDETSTLAALRTHAPLRPGNEGGRGGTISPPPSVRSASTAGPQPNHDAISPSSRTASVLGGGPLDTPARAEGTTSSPTVWREDLSTAYEPGRRRGAGAGGDERTFVTTASQGLTGSEPRRENQVSNPSGNDPPDATPSQTPSGKPAVANNIDSTFGSDHGKMIGVTTGTHSLPPPLSGTLEIFPKRVVSVSEHYPMSFIPQHADKVNDPFQTSTPLSTPQSQSLSGLSRHSEESIFASNDIHATDLQSGDGLSHIHELHGSAVAFITYGRAWDPSSELGRSATTTGGSSTLASSKPGVDVPSLQSSSASYHPASSEKVELKTSSLNLQPSLAFDTSPGTFAAEFTTARSGPSVSVAQSSSLSSLLSSLSSSSSSPPSLWLSTSSLQHASLPVTGFPDVSQVSRVTPDPSFSVQPAAFTATEPSGFPRTHAVHTHHPVAASHSLTGSPSADPNPSGSTLPATASNAATSPDRPELSRVEGSTTLAAAASAVAAAAAVDPSVRTSGSPALTGASETAALYWASRRESGGVLSTVAASLPTEPSSNVTPLPSRAAAVAKAVSGDDGAQSSTQEMGSSDTTTSASSSAGYDVKKLSNAAGSAPELAEDNFLPSESSAFEVTAAKDETTAVAHGSSGRGGDVTEDDAVEGDGGGATKTTESVGGQSSRADAVAPDPESYASGEERDGETGAGTLPPAPSSPTGGDPSLTGITQEEAGKAVLGDDRQWTDAPGKGEEIVRQSENVLESLPAIPTEVIESVTSKELDIGECRRRIRPQDVSLHQNTAPWGRVGPVINVAR
ncbi:uncharacterized protein LOC144729472 isoform X1 [Lampetra planeri]